MLGDWKLGEGSISSAILNRTTIKAGRAETYGDLVERSRPKPKRSNAFPKPNRPCVPADEINALLRTWGVAR